MSRSAARATAHAASTQHPAAAGSARPGGMALSAVRQCMGSHHARLHDVQRPQAGLEGEMKVEGEPGTVYANKCPHCGGNLRAYVNSKEKVHPYRVVCNKCGVGSAWHGDIAAAWRSVEAVHARPEQKTWRCFHCEQVFVTEHSARQHFGSNEDRQPACILASDTTLLELYRRVEDELAELRWRMLEEDTEAAKAHYGHRARHATALRAAEESGYAKGLADGKALAAGATPG